MTTTSRSVATSIGMITTYRHELLTALDAHLQQRAVSVSRFVHAVAALSNEPFSSSHHSLTRFGTEHRQLPRVGSLVVAHEIRIAVGTSQFEVPVLGCQPRIEHFRDSNATVTKNERAGRLLSAMAGVALHTNR
jgi:hypothetical protein